MTDLSHLHALELRLSHERERLARATRAVDIEHRQVWIVQIKREIAHERKFLGLPDEAPSTEMTDDELLAALSA